MSRYAYADVVRRIRRQVESTGQPLKAILVAVNISPDQWSRKSRLNRAGNGGKGTSFTLDELSRIADYFDAGPGWPFVDWDYARVIEAAINALNRLEAGSNPPESKAKTPTE